jgi:hypothetical protein
MSLDTHCGAGHEYTPANTYTWRSKEGYDRRFCRECKQAKQVGYEAGVTTIRHLMSLPSPLTLCGLRNASVVLSRGVSTCEACVAMSIAGDERRRLRTHKERVARMKYYRELYIPMDLDEVTQ